MITSASQSNIVNLRFNFRYARFNRFAKGSPALAVLNTEYLSIAMKIWAWRPHIKTIFGLLFNQDQILKDNILFCTLFTHT